MNMEVFSKQIEQRNQSSILQCIEQTDEISRAGIAKVLGLSRTTVSSAVAHLMKSGLVEERMQTDATQSRGRPGIPLSLTRNIWYAAGTAFIDQELLFVLTDLQGNIIDVYKRQPLDHAFPGFQWRQGAIVWPALS